MNHPRAIFRFTKVLQAVFQHGSTIFHLWVTYSLCFLTSTGRVSPQVGARRLTGIWMCISLRVNDVEHLFTHRFAVYGSSLVEWLFISAVNFLTCLSLLFFTAELCNLLTNSEYKLLVRCVVCKRFLQAHNFSLHPLIIRVIWIAKLFCFKFWWSSVHHTFLYGSYC